MRDTVSDCHDTKCAVLRDVFSFKSELVSPHSEKHSRLQEFKATLYLKTTKYVSRIVDIANVRGKKANMRGIPLFPRNKFDIEAT